MARRTNAITVVAYRSKTAARRRFRLIQATEPEARRSARFGRAGGLTEGDAGSAAIRTRFVRDADGRVSAIPCGYEGAIDLDRLRQTSSSFELDEQRPRDIQRRKQNRGRANRLGSRPKLDGSLPEQPNVSNDALAVGSSRRRSHWSNRGTPGEARSVMAANPLACKAFRC
jgi:hypothetical protein